MVEGVSFSISSGECLVLSGANGCGKSTIIKGILGFSAILSGTVIKGVPKEKTGYVPQESQIESDLPVTALDIVRSAKPLEWKRAGDEAKEVLLSMGLGDKADCRYSVLSGGQKRRVLVARALMGRPELLLLDEPCAYADRGTVDIIENKLHELIEKQDVAIVAVNHNHDISHFARVYDVEKKELLV